MTRRHLALATLAFLALPTFPGVSGLNPPPAGHEEPPTPRDQGPAAPAHRGAAAPRAGSDGRAAQEGIGIRLSRSPAPDPIASAPRDAAGALAALRDGNARWASGAADHPNTGSARRQELAGAGQKPFVTVLTCSDSRVPVERILDRGVGDVFVVRVAGNVAGASEAATVEYGVGHLNTPLLVVMGHTRCGAVAAAASGAEVHGMVARLVAGVTPAVDRARRANPELTGDALAAAAVRENVWQTIFDLYKSSDVCREMVKDGRLTVVGAVYDIATGRIEWLGEHPWQLELIDAIAARGGAPDAHGAAAHHDDGHE